MRVLIVGGMLGERTRIDSIPKVITAVVMEAVRREALSEIHIVQDLVFVLEKQPETPPPSFESLVYVKALNDDVEEVICNKEVFTQVFTTLFKGNKYKKSQRIRCRDPTHQMVARESYSGDHFI